MDKRKGVLNVAVAIVFRFLMLIGAMVVRRCVIRYIGNEINGLDSLYTSLIGFLSVAELGIGTAITFCMYKPVVEQDTAKIAALYQLFAKVYRVIGGVILVAGIALIPFIPYLAKDYAQLNVNFGSTFFLMLISVVISYVFSAKTSLINAYKNNYITTAISSGGLLFQCVLQIVVVIATGSFVWYLVCRTVAMLLQWGVTEICTRKMHRQILQHPKTAIDAATKKEIVDKVKAMFMHRLGGVLVNSADSMIISAYIGVVILGKYSNYTTVVVAMASVLALFFTPLTSVIGHTFVTEKAQTERLFQKLHFLNFALGAVFYLGYYAVIDNLVTLLFVAGIELPKAVSFVVTVNYFVQFMRQAPLLFKDATGTFYHDRWRPLVEGITNVVLSIAFVHIFGRLGGDELGVVGVIVATVITNLAICHIIDTFVLYKHAFEMPAKKQLLKNYCYIALFAAVLLLMSRCMQTNDSQWLEMLINGGISLAFSGLLVAAVFCADKVLGKRKGF